MPPLKAACVQINGTNDPAQNTETVIVHARAAKADGAELIATPEVTNMLEPDKRAAREKAFLQEEDPTLARFRELARELDVWFLAGSLVIARPDSDRLANRSVLISPDGNVRATYDKIHMFDVELGSGEQHRESSAYEPGANAVVAGTPWGGLGLTVCYDVRFPQLYRDLARAGADFVTVPSAFTRPTGQAHWHVLLRARAIENGVFILAPAQCGEHARGRKTYGHSLIVNPWGEVIAEAGEEPGHIIAELDAGEVREARRKIPSLYNARSYARP